MQNDARLAEPALARRAAVLREQAVGRCANLQRELAACGDVARARAREHARAYPRTEVAARAAGIPQGVKILK